VPNWIVLLLIFIEGFVSISIEILTLRQITPFVGNTIVITTTVIGFFLLALAFGYMRGGQRHGAGLRQMVNNFVIASLFAGVGLSYLFIEMTFQSLAAVGLPGYVTLVIYLILITSPAVYLLGQTIPLATRLFKSGGVSQISGRVLFLSTIGSFVGAIGTAAILFMTIGVAHTVFITFSALIVCALIIEAKTAQRVQVFITLFVGMLAIYIINVDHENSRFISSNAYAYVEIDSFHDEEYGGTTKEFRLDNNQTSLRRQDNTGYAYIELMKKIMFEDLQLRNNNILSLGSGGFSLTAQSAYGNTVTYVDINPELDDVALQGFQDRINGVVVTQDARQYLREHPGEFDAIVMDVFSKKYSIPEHLVTIEAMTDLKSAVRPGGFVLMNVVMDSYFRDTYSRRILSTVNTVFGPCSVIPLHLKDNVDTNNIIVCRVKKTFAIESAPGYYTDNHNQSSIDMFNR